MNIFGYAIDFTICIGIIQIFIGIIGIFCSTSKNTADRGSFINTGINNSCVHIDNSKNENNIHPKYKIIRIIFIAIIAIGIVLVISRLPV